MTRIKRQQGILTPTPQTYQADLSGAQATRELTSLVVDTANVIKAKAEQKFDLMLKNQAQEEINGAFERNQNNPEQFNKEIAASRKGIVTAVPSNRRQEFSYFFDQQSRPYLNKVTQNHERQLTDEIKFNTLKRLEMAQVSAANFASGLFSGDPVQAADSSMALQSLVMDSASAVTAVDARGEHVIGASERFRLMKNFIDEVAYNSVRSGYDDAVDKQEYLRRFENGELKASIFLDEQGEFVEQSVKDSMDRSAYERTVNYMQSDIIKLQKEAAIVNTQQMQLDMMDKVKKGEYVLNPFDKQHQAAVNYDYEKFNEQLQGLPTDMVTQSKVDYVSNIGVVPEALKGEIIGLLANGSVEQKATAADVVERIADERPSVLSQFSERERVKARQITQNLDAGIEPEAAIALADKYIYEKDTPQFKQRMAMFKDEKLEFKEGKFTSFFENDPDEVPAGMIADYNTLVERYYMEGGLNAESADELAIQTVSSKWKKSNISGQPRWMKYAPEVIYDNGMGGEWMREQLLTEVTSRGWLVDDMNKFEDSLLLEVSPDSVGGKLPYYRIFSQEDNGRIRPLVDGSGQQLTFIPEYESSPEFKRVLEESSNNKEEAMRRVQLLRKARVVEANVKSVREGF